MPRLLGVLPAIAAIAVTLVASAPPALAGRAEDVDALIDAAAHGRTDEVRQLLARDVAVDARNGSGMTALIVAAGRGEMGVVRDLLDAGADPNAQSPDGGTALSGPVAEGDLVLTRALLNAGADPRRLADRGERLLTLAAQSGKAELVDVLLAAGAESTLCKDPRVLRQLVAAGDRALLTTVLDPQRRKDWPAEALKLAALKRDLPLLKVLIGIGLPVDGATRSGDTPLLVAIGMRAPELAAFLLAAGADPTRPDRDGDIPLAQAVTYDDLATVRDLLARGASIDQVPPTPGKTALTAAADSNKIELARFLLERKADPNLADANGQSPLALAAGHHDGAVVKELLAHGARIPASLGPHPQAHPLHRASTGCRIESLRALLAAGGDPTLLLAENLNTCPSEMFDMLVAAGVDLDRPDAAGETLLLAVAAGKNPETTRHLLELGADVSATGPRGETPLHRACSEWWNEETVEVLLAHRADVRARDESGQTALHKAAAAQAFRSLALLAAAGADSEAKDRSGQTPFDLYQSAFTTSHLAGRQDGVRARFLLPQEFNHCTTPERPPAEDENSLVRCTSERQVQVEILQPDGDVDLRSLARGTDIQSAQLARNDETVPMVRYRPGPDDIWGGVSDPARVLALVPWSPDPLLVRVTALRRDGLAADWIARGVVLSLAEPAGEGSPLSAFHGYSYRFDWKTVFFVLVALILVAAVVAKARQI